MDLLLLALHPAPKYATMADMSAPLLRMSQATMARSTCIECNEKTQVRMKRQINKAAKTAETTNKIQQLRTAIFICVAYNSSARMLRNTNAKDTATRMDSSIRTPVNTNFVAS